MSETHVNEFSFMSVAVSVACVTEILVGQIAVPARRNTAANITPTDCAGHSFGDDSKMSKLKRNEY
jgi:hypothetical protein